ncbi:hypothetical protein C8Q70DRAFT_1057070 [Cubamyces menziesii]|uniref:Uncharacterized protein n=1 Tax=Trametes cubensis TaxID=1111947 RepID=A0AAD7THR4_9APHY|nr:hypothetical protein C8Q70DRAFT_1057070 [Cubamyces menziesii]KAJ8457668.1 hypothetical protein ONZ51_g11389 [Trametes cubensis]
MSTTLSPTRSGNRAALENRAQIHPERRDVHITTVPELQTFVMLGNYNENIGCAVEYLNISLPEGEGYPAQAVRAVLRMIPNVKCLVLNLPFESPVSLLNGVTLLSLRTLSTNLPHRGLVAFLVTHHFLTALMLGTCGRSATCPLRGLRLEGLQSLQSPSSCFTGITAGPLVTATVNLTRLTSMSALAIHNISSASSRLYSLAVDHFSNDYDILSRVAAAAPNLRKLKLNEKPTTERGEGRLRRPWNDIRGWHLTLLQMTHLEELHLRTSISVATPTSKELDVVTGWANGVGDRAIAHPSLYHIAIIQNASGEHQLSHWFKKGPKGNQVWILVSSALVQRNETFTL